LSALQTRYASAIEAAIAEAGRMRERVTVEVARQA